MANTPRNSQTRVNAQLIRRLREDRAWSQEDLAQAAGLNSRTIQRIERDGTASLQSQRALADALAMDPTELSDNGIPRLSPCPECGSDEVYRSTRWVETTTIGGELLPGLSARRLSSAKVQPVVCASCGYLRFYVDDDARKHLRTSEQWRRA